MAKILVIEDDSLLLEFLKEALKHEGFDVIAASNGDKGIALAKKQIPDIILSDINMPGKNGHDVLRELQEDPATSNIPFIFLTGKVEMNDLRQGMTMGADDYLMKPVNISELVNSVKTRLKKHRKLARKYQDEVTRTMLSLEKTINYDEFTGLPKKAILQKKIKEVRFNSLFDQNAALMIVRLDRMRGITEAFGQDLIKQVIKRISNAVENKAEIYWLDGEEFGLFFSENESSALLKKLARSLLNEIRKSFIVKKQELYFKASIGISQSLMKDLNFTRLLSEAELAVNYSVEKGYSNFQFYEPKMKKHVFERIRLEGALHRAVEKNELIIHYQPKYQLSDEKLIGLEALVRWEHEEFGMVSPSQFIPIAENNGLINEIGDYIIQRICQQIIQWQQNGVKIPRVAINVSGGQLAANDFFQRISFILNDAGIDGKNLEFELTESILVQNSEEMAQKLNEFKKLGIDISIDDFGTGYSSLQYLKNFPHDKIKIDQSFIRDLTSDKNSASIVTTIISMAHKLGVRVIAEGVESSDQVDFLRKHKCDEIQGYFYSKPITADQLTDVLTSYN
jgi:diguanylate cyclase (GGDEF)-like protein